MAGETSLAIIGAVIVAFWTFIAANLNGEELADKIFKFFALMLAMFISFNLALSAAQFVALDYAGLHDAWGAIAGLQFAFFLLFFFYNAYKAIRTVAGFILVGIKKLA